MGVRETSHRLVLEKVSSEPIQASRVNPINPVKSEDLKKSLASWLWDDSYSRFYNMAGVGCGVVPTYALYQQCVYVCLCVCVCVCVRVPLTSTVYKPWVWSPEDMHVQSSRVR